MDPEPAKTPRPANGSDQGKKVGVPDWPTAWPLPICNGPLAKYQLRGRMLDVLGDKVSTALPRAEHERGAAQASAREELLTIAKALRPFCHSVADSLERAASSGGGWPQSGFVGQAIRDARQRVLRDSMHKRWSVANGPPLEIDELWPLLDTRHKVESMAHWFEASQAGGSQEGNARSAMRLHLDALEPGEVAVTKLGIPVDRAQHTREQAIALLDAKAPLVDVGRAAGAVAAAWQTLHPRIMALRPPREPRAVASSVATSPEKPPIAGASALPMAVPTANPAAAKRATEADLRALLDEHAECHGAIRLTRADLAHILGCRPQAISDRVKRKTLPPPVDRVRNVKRWALQDVADLVPQGEARDRLREHLHRVLDDAAAQGPARLRKARKVEVSVES